MQIGMQPLSSEFENVNPNFYTLDKSMFNYKDITEQQLSEQEKKKSQFGFQFTNFTAIKEQIKDDPNFDDAFPRWIAKTKIINPDARTKSTSCVAIIGVRLFKFKLAYIGFPQREGYWSGLRIYDICALERRDYGARNYS